MGLEWHGITACSHGSIWSIWINRREPFWSRQKTWLGSPLGHQETCSNLLLLRFAVENLIRGCWNSSLVARFGVRYYRYGMLWLLLLCYTAMYWKSWHLRWQSPKTPKLLELTTVTALHHFVMKCPTRDKLKCRYWFSISTWNARLPMLECKGIQILGWRQMPRKMYKNMKENASGT